MFPQGTRDVQSSLGGGAAWRLVCPAATTPHSFRNRKLPPTLTGYGPSGDQQSKMPFRTLTEG